ncbi:MAG: 4-hydroxy-3-methylbut-2-en-1-yl diphosphate synthase [Crocinitomicaceae bacterium TMED114]|nr:MAG: 4-hydroxy-3-methylbut-2-en-1-yl diphosphate synthase [Crocinitomicaceae bacterium TMED114]
MTPESPDPSSRRMPTRPVQIGGVTVGGQAPIVLQSMTTADTMDIEATVAESLRMIEAGCQIVRITAPSKKEATALGEIRARLDDAGHAGVPLVADIHFTPNAAEIAADHVEKIRVNPGNYADKKKFEVHDYTAEAYADELARIRERFTPLVRKCKSLGRAMRIGTNHGSLSDRILSHYGDTPLGMVESALEFLRICRDEDYHDIVLSMKASNPQVMVQAYRMLADRMQAEGMAYPLHLGVTEAGEGEDGRIKSAVGIGTLLAEGLGDTVRVSLTEPPEAEIPVARLLVELAESGRQAADDIAASTMAPANHDRYTYRRRTSSAVGGVGGTQVPVVCHDLTGRPLTAAGLFGLGHRYQPDLDKWAADDAACDLIFVGDRTCDFALPGWLYAIQDAEAWSHHRGQRERHHPLWLPAAFDTALENGGLDPHFNLLSVEANDLTLERAAELAQHNGTPVTLLLSTDRTNALLSLRAAFFRLDHAGCTLPVIVRHDLHGLTADALQLKAAADLGGLLLDGYGDGIWVAGDVGLDGGLQSLNRTAFGILQATRTRISRTEYISCPSCGRTLFDLQETTAKIRAVTDHLKGVKIGIMGCIVNGPGEMADADYGYVGTGPGKITLYKEKEVVQRNIPEDEAVDALIELIRSHGDWVEAPDRASASA